MNTTNKTAVEELETEIRMAMIGAKSDPRTPKAEHYTKLLQMIEKALTQAHQQGVQEGVERIKPFVERVRLDVDVIVCDCGEKYKDSDLDLSVGELEKALHQSGPLAGKE